MYTYIYAHICCTKFNAGEARAPALGRHRAPWGRMLPLPVRIVLVSIIMIIIIMIIIIIIIIYDNYYCYVYYDYYYYCLSVEARRLSADVFVVVFRQTF